MTHSAQRRQLLSCAAGGLAAGLAWPVMAQSGNWPNRPIKWIVSQPAGAGPDILARYIADQLARSWGSAVVVENRPGGQNVIGTQAAARSAPDGYTIVVADTGTHAIAPQLYGSRLQYDVFRDFTPISLAASFPTVLLVHPSVPARTPQEFVALVKSQPGKLTYSSAGTGNGSHLAQDVFRYAAGGLDMIHVPYKGGAPAIQALIAVVSPRTSSFRIA